MAVDFRIPIWLASMSLAACGGAAGDDEGDASSGSGGAGGGGDPSCACDADEVEIEGHVDACDDFREDTCRLVACEGYIIACIVMVPCTEIACGPSLVGLGCEVPGEACEQYGCHFESAGTLTCSPDQRWERP